MKASALLFLLLPLFAGAQLKYDANWVFGERCGIDFNDSLNPITFSPLSDNNEATASISDKNGNMVLYVSCPRNYLGHIKDANNDTIINGDSINAHSSATNGMVFLPIGRTGDSVLLFHIGMSPNCNFGSGFVRCLRLYYSLIARDGSGKWGLRRKTSSSLPIRLKKL
ncbi:hypothetical protein BH09BAC1_BH09BAC1_17640 [soil metagenome]